VEEREKVDSITRRKGEEGGELIRG